ncbi:hypothetical protein PtrCC142_009808 [Pyrenophora tritici-repentis]|nr:hypothetical protein PtrSN001C_010051 [Pyrenophora tritici-repentis]KAI1596272.1 hypothetical protein PtrCC142_009808 [Pyrenophora tritici-repentis]
MTHDTILKSFQATSVWPMEPQVILKRFNNNTTTQYEAPQVGEHGDGDSWSQLRKIFEAAVADTARVQNELLHHDNDGLRAALTVKQKRKKNSKPLDLQHAEEYHGGAVFWSPGKIHDARAREATKQHHDELLQLQKLEAKQQKAQAALYKEQIAEEAKAQRQADRARRAEERKARAKHLADSRALKKQQRDAETAQKARDRLNTSKRKASQALEKISTKRRGVVGVESQPNVAPGPPSPPPKTTTRGRQINKPAKYR